MRARLLVPFLGYLASCASCASPPPSSPQAAPPDGSSGAPSAPAEQVIKRPGEGYLEHSIIDGVVRRDFAKFRACYDAAVERNPLLKGRVTVELKILPDGSVGSPASTADTTLPDARVVRCVVRAWGELKFPPPDGGPYTITYPLDFAPVR